MAEVGTETGILQNPVPGHPITSDFGPRTHPVTGQRGSQHNGIDIGAPTGTPVSAADGGTVVFAQRAGSFGNVVVLRHDTPQGPFLTYYAHLHEIDVRKGQEVGQGQPIGEVGSTGRSTGPHLHFELRREDRPFSKGGFPGGRVLDPEPLLGRSYTDAVTLRNGDRGADVTNLQTQLVELEYLTPADIDGGFGDRTEAAVKAFQRSQSLEDDGIVGRNTRQALQQELQVPERSQPEPQPNPQPAPARQPITAIETAIETDGPFAAVSRSEIVSLRTQGEGNSLGALTQEQTYDTARAVFGDSYGARALIALDRAYGPDGGDGTLVKRELALGLHEGRLEFGRQNRDPASGYNFGTFQIGGFGTTPAQSQERYNTLIERGIANYEELTGETVDRRQLTPADRDIFSHIGHMEERSTFPVFYGNETGLFRDLANPSLEGAALRRFISTNVQGGIGAIGESVDRWTDRETGLRVDLEAVARRANEPDTIRREPAAPVLDPNIAADYSPAVEEVQQILKEAGYGRSLGASGPNQDGIDGNLGSRTVRAIGAFQADRGLAADGIVGKNTWDALLGAARSQEIERDAPQAEPPEAIVPIREASGTPNGRLWTASSSVLTEAIRQNGVSEHRFSLPSGTPIIVTGNTATQTIAITSADGTPIATQQIEDGQLISTVDNPEVAAEFVEHVESVLRVQASEVAREEAGTALE